MRMTGSGRVGWAAVPPAVRSGIEAALGAPVETATSLSGGFSDGFAGRVHLADGRDAFVKASSETFAAGFHRTEAAIARRLPRSVPTPAFLGSYDDGEWVAAAFEFVDATIPEQPWRPADFERVLDTVVAMSAALTPAPPDVPAVAAPRLDLPRPLGGNTLLHGDLYPFNVLVAPASVSIVDWPHAWIGPAYADALLLLSSARLGGIDPQRCLDRHPLTRDADPADVDTFLGAHARFHLRLAARATDPALSAMARSLGEASRDWLLERSGPRKG